jgi:hypothetical protein
MKKYFIKIDLRTIRKNPNAGSQTTYIPGRSTIRFTGSKLPSCLVEGVNCFITEWVSDQNGTEINGVINGSLTEEQILIIKKETPDFYIEFEREVITYNHLPEPDYFYGYCKTKVKCNYCGRIFKYDRLNNHHWDGETFLDHYCPYCEEPECCEIEYEDIEDALKRKNERSTKTI